MKDLISKLRSGGAERYVRWKIDPYEGLDFIFDGKTLNNPDQSAINNPYFGVQLAYLKGLHEQGFAEKNSNGYTVSSDNVAELDDDFFQLFELPPLFMGRYKSRIEGRSTQSTFSIHLDLILPDGQEVPSYTLEGPFLKLAEDEIYRLSPAEWRALNSVSTHRELPAEKKGEYENNWLVFQLQLAKKAGMRIDLAHFNNLELIRPDVIGVTVEEMANGDLALTPAYGSGIDVKDIKSRLGQLRDDQAHCILRVKDRFVLLDQDRLNATHEILTNNRIPKEQVSNFLKSPTAYLNAALIDLDTGFSLRVHGAERFTHKYFGDVEKSGIDWFSAAQGMIEPIKNLSSMVDTQEVLIELTERIDDARKNGADTLEYDGRQFDISDSNSVDETLSDIQLDITNGASPVDIDDEIQTVTEARAVVAIDSNDEEEDFVRDARFDGLNLSEQFFSEENLKRKPFPHQNVGIHWLLAHMELSRSSGEGSGALLADDMGLGKTYMILVAIAEWYKRCKIAGLQEKPVMIVAPLSLLENWQAEVDETFHKSPFNEIVLLQTGGDLARFRVKGAGRETQQEFKNDDLISEQDQIRYSLKVGSVYGTDRLDMQNRLVLTTYQTLRDYQFSLSRIDWGIVAFDEAQNLKNPNTLATRAAKGLKADFKLLATGTPVENSLKDFWCLMDTAIPGLLGAWQSFRSTYITPITSAKNEEVLEIKINIGRKLRESVGEYMLRRTKAEQLKGLPVKRVFSGDSRGKVDVFKPALAATMSGAQLTYYDEIIERVKASTAEDKRKLILPSLLRLKISSIHQDIEAKIRLPESPKALLKQAEASSKILSMLTVLKEIEGRGEKVLIFATTKVVQAYVCALVTSLFKIHVEIINGETNAIANRKDSETRKGIIDRFQQQSGFGVIVMSPVAAGVGLTVVGANNVIHLERHWNPAKEAQATDRVYRIGQKRDVNVYLPMALHPSLRSFDLQLNNLLANKVDLSDAVVATDIIESQDLASCF